MTQRTSLRLLFLVVLLLTVATSECQTPLSLGEHTTKVNGVLLWYKVSGHLTQGRAPVLFLHGGPGYNSFSFEHTVGSQLEENNLLIYLDQRGSGRSERPQDGDYTLPTLLRDIEDLRNLLGLSSISIMGHSFGGTLALEYAAQYPAHIQSLIVLDGVVDMPATFAMWSKQLNDKYPAIWRRIAQQAKTDRLRLGYGAVDDCSTAISRSHLVNATLERVDSRRFRLWQQFHRPSARKEQGALDRRSSLTNTGEFSAAYFGPDSTFACYTFTAFERITMPTLVMVGAYDRVVGVDQMRTLVSRLPHATLDVFPSSGHFVYAEEPRRFLDDVERFLKQAQPSPHAQVLDTSSPTHVNHVSD